MGLFDKVRQLFSKAERVLPGTGPASDHQAVDDQTFDDQAFDERVFEDRDAALGSEQPAPGAAEPTSAAAPGDDPHVPAPDEGAGTGGEGQQPPSQRYRTHTIVPDQSLAQIAEQHGVALKDLAELNGRDPDLIFAGQVVRIPHG